MQLKYRLLIKEETHQKIGGIFETKFSIQGAS